MHALLLCCVLLLLSTPQKYCFSAHVTSAQNSNENGTWGKAANSTHQHSKGPGAGCRQQVGQLGCCCSALHHCVTPKLSRCTKRVICK